LASAGIVHWILEAKFELVETLMPTNSPLLLGNMFTLLACYLEAKLELVETLMPASSALLLGNNVHFVGMRPLGQSLSWLSR
jgi:hypothetical protein